MSNINSHINQEKLFEEVSNLIEVTQRETLRKVSQTGVLLYWHIGQRIDREILKLNRAEYGKDIISQLAKNLQIKFGQGFGERIIYRCIQFTKLFQEENIVNALSEHLKWSVKAIFISVVSLIAFLVLMLIFKLRLIFKSW